MSIPRQRTVSERLVLEELEPRLVPSGAGQPLGPLTWLHLVWQTENVAAGLSTGPPAQAVSAPSIEVHAGQSIQAAVNAAAPGTVIFLDPGTYKESITIAKPDIFLVGLNQPGGGSVVLANPGDADNGINVTSQGAGFTLLNVTVQGFGENGVLLTGVQRFLIDHVNAVHDGEYGIFPVLSLNGLIARSSASGNRDTGIYVGQSANVAVLGNTTFGNVNGIEIENSLNALVAANISSGNTAGILVDLLPGLTVPVADNIVVENNLVRGNNLPNFGTPSGIASLVPSGIGILVLGTSDTTLQNNAVLGNQKIGIGVLSTEVLNLLGGGPVFGIEPDPNNTQVHGNTALGAPFGADLLWDGTGSGNSWVDNVFLTSVSPVPLPEGG
jgi:parallel beta-helix repeat protein